MRFTAIAISATRVGSNQAADGVWQNKVEWLANSWRVELIGARLEIVAAASSTPSSTSSPNFAGAPLTLPKLHAQSNSAAATMSDYGGDDGGFGDDGYEYVHGFFHMELWRIVGAGRTRQRLT